MTRIITIGCCRPFGAATTFPLLRGYKSAPKPGVRTYVGVLLSLRKTNGGLACERGSCGPGCAYCSQST
ncbi:hypothetical protein DT594_09420 [Halopseudomonas laoshanensis]|uniref:Uncharacterized protein n=1 Tax=Halopseudomonas laoshanensis TaxID=2268758 RepID=A0A7V7GUE3_9GAMM|nr:hypothetical protein DT594_09420 [Halopseudomonas laoshanensis]